METWQVLGEKAQCKYTYWRNSQTICLPRSINGRLTGAVESKLFSPLLYMHWLRPRNERFLHVLAAPLPYWHVPRRCESVLGKMIKKFGGGLLFFLKGGVEEREEMGLCSGWSISFPFTLWNRETEIWASRECKTAFHESWMLGEYLLG